MRRRREKVLSQTLQFSSFFCIIKFSSTSFVFLNPKQSGKQCKKLYDERDGEAEKQQKTKKKVKLSI